eukprot:gene1382-806_t
MEMELGIERYGASHHHHPINDENNNNSNNNNNNNVPLKTNPVLSGFLNP